MSKPCVMLAAGGTGGHLFPAFALSQELGRRGYDVDLVTDQRGDRYGMGFPAREVHQVPAATLKSRTPWGLARTAITMLRGIAASRRVLRDVRPKVIGGFGGYPTVPPLLAAKMAGIPTFVHEQNAVMGRANRLLAPRVSAVALSFEETKYLSASASRSRVTGTPVRDAVIDWSGRPYQAPAAEGPLSLLVFGGSQGARFFSDTLPPALGLLPDDLRSRLAVVQQCREEDVERVRAAYDRAGVDAELATFFDNLPERIASAHLVVARAGASTVTELAVLGRPSILVPLPHALDNDQLENATRLEEAGGAWCMAQAELTSERLASELQRLFTTPSALAEAAGQALTCGRPNAVALLADLVEELSAQSGR